MAGKQRTYDLEYKIQAVKLSKEIGGAKAAAELGVPADTLYGWTRAAREGRLDIGPGGHTPESAMSLAEYGILQSMNSDGGRCHDNARCESMWARMKCELFYDRLDSEQFTIQELKTLVWRYFISYWNNRRICSANGGLPPAVKRERYYKDQLPVVT